MCLLQNQTFCTSTRDFSQRYLSFHLPILCVVWFCFAVVFLQFVTIFFCVIRLVTICDIFLLCTQISNHLFFVPRSTDTDACHFKTTKEVASAQYRVKQREVVTSSFLTHVVKETRPEYKSNDQAFGKWCLRMPMMRWVLKTSEDLENVVGPSAVRGASLFAHEDIPEV